MMQQTALFGSIEQDIYAAIAAAGDWVYTIDIRHAIGQRDIYDALNTLVDGGTVEQARRYFGAEKPGKNYLGFQHVYRIKRKEAA